MSNELPVDSTPADAKDTSDIQATLTKFLSTDPKSIPAAPAAQAHKVLSGSMPVKDPAPAVRPAAPAVKISGNMIEVTEPAAPVEVLGLKSPPPPPELQGAPEPVQPSNQVLPSQDAPPPGDDPRANAAWAAKNREIKELKASMEALKAKEREFQKQVEEAKALKTQKELELEKRAEELEEKIGRYSFKETRVYQEKFTEPINRELGKAASALIRSGMDQAAAKDTVLRLMRSTDDAELDSAIRDIPRQYQGVVSTALFNAQDLARQAQDAEQNWKQTRVALEADSSKVEEQRFRKSLVSDTTAAAGELSDKYGSWVYSPDPDNTQWMAQREKLVLEAQHVLHSGTDRDYARYVLEGAAAPIYRRYVEILKSEVADLRKELSAREAVKPRLGGGGNPPPAPQRVEKPSSMSIEEGLGALFGKDPIR